MARDKSYWLDAIMGLVVGDACGVPVEFKGREELRQDPVTDMRGYGTYNLPKGAWSDDSSMALATLKSLHNGYDLKDIAEQFSRWDREALYTPYGAVFDMGMTCSQAIHTFQRTGDPYQCGKSGERDNGNGSLMRIMPMCLYIYEKVKTGELDENDGLHMIHEVSALTHAHLRSKMACGLYYFCVKAVLEHKQEKSIRECIQKGFDDGFDFYRQEPGNLVEIVNYERLIDLTFFKEAQEDSIGSSGYVLESLEAAIWCLLNTDDYESCILKAVNLGSDTDTVAAIAGGLAGLYYGYEGIPASWRDCIARKDWIIGLCDF